MIYCLHEFLIGTISRVLLCLFLIMLVGQELSPVFAAAVEVDGGGASATSELTITPESLLAEAVAARKEGDMATAFDLYAKVYYDFPEEPIAAKAIWQLAEYKKHLAQEGKVPWESVKDAYRNYVSSYPGANNIAQAYFEVGVSLYFMRYQREALSYFKLAVQRLPDNELAGKAELWQAKVLLGIGRVAEASEKYSDLANNGDAQIRLRALVGQAEILNIKKQFTDSLKIYHELAGQQANFFLAAPESLRIFGQANLLAGNVERGRGQLLHYLNVAEGYVDRPAILFQVAESYWRQKKYLVAKKMYQLVVEEGRAGDQAVVLSQMRIAMYLDDPQRETVKWERFLPLTDSQGDKPYIEVLDKFYDNPIAQDARLGLFRRFAARNDIAGMLDYGQNYLRIARFSEMTLADKQKGGEVLLELAERLLAEKKYQKLYNLYYSEHEHVKDFHNGRLLYLVGQAMDAMVMYDQAALIYYRALKWPLSKADKIDLYYRRANVYLLMGDLASADRLLKYLRKIYAGSKELGEIMSYSGRLREAQERDVEALAFYRSAADIATFSEKKVKYASDVIRLASALDSSAAMTEINSYKSSGILAGVALQKWYGKAGDTLRELGKCNEAVLAYEAALAEDLQGDGNVTQAVHLYLGDCLLALGNEGDALTQYKAAREGENEMLKTMALERLNQQEIDNELARLKSK